MKCQGKLTILRKAKSLLIVILRSIIFLTMDQAIQQWDKHKQALFAFIYSQTKDKELTKDLMQETFIRFHRQYESLLNKGKIKSWLFAVSRNLVMDHHRLKNREGKQNLMFDDNSKQNENERMMGCMISFIEKLPAKYKEVIKMAELSGITQTRLARELDISYSGLKSRLQRAKMSLKISLERCCSTAADKYGNIVDMEPREKCPCATCQ
jgi:RNA polymerase sigma-70 factor (ECF subfamily)